MVISITGYNAICNLGNNIDEIYSNALLGRCDYFEIKSDYIKGSDLFVGTIKTDLPQISDENFNIRCNRLILYTLNLMKEEINSLIDKYTKDRIAVICATTNSGVQEFETTKNILHPQIGNPAFFIKEYLGLKNFYTSVSTACSSGIKAFSLARDILNSGIADAIIVVGADSLSKLPLYGFNSLEVLSDKLTNPFSANRSGINIGETSSIFIVEKDNIGIEILGIGENSDTYHQTTPDPNGTEEIKAIKEALGDAKIKPDDIDYINLHGTGTMSNDLMEANAIFNVFGDKIPASSTKPLTGHCLGASASLESALCCKLLDSFEGKFFPHIYDGQYDNSLPKIKLVTKNDKYNECNICMCNSFGFGGTNAIIILGKSNGK